LRFFYHTGTPTGPPDVPSYVPQAGPAAPGNCHHNRELTSWFIILKQWKLQINKSHLIYSTASTDVPPDASDLPPGASDLSNPNELNTAACQQVNQIRDGTVYLKSSCLMTIPATWIDANDYCYSLGMRLFTIDSLIAQSEIQKISLAIYGPNYASLWINGKNTDSVWYYYMPLKVNSFSGLVLNAQSTVADSCLKVTNNYPESSYHVSGQICSANYYFYCEF